MSVSDQQTVVFGEKLAGSQAFSSLFKRGMALVEETATYLDGQGREDARYLDRSLSLIYATESMRLTTRLMQLASWLLLHRAVNEGELTLEDARKEKSKVRLAAYEPIEAETFSALPASFGNLIELTRALHNDVTRMDTLMYETRIEPPSQENPVVQQMDALRAAFVQDV